VSWVRVAVAEQEEYLKRQHGCKNQVFLPHTYDVAASGQYRECMRCGVTATFEDYKIKMGNP
jgi:hypothetical protein